MLRTTRGVSSFPEKLLRCTAQSYYHYKEVDGCSISRKKLDVTLEWPLTEIDVRINL